MIAPGRGFFAGAEILARERVAMKILIGTESFHPNISGVAVTTLNLARYLAQRNHGVVVVAPSPNRRTFLETHPDGFAVWRIRSIPHPFRKGFRVTVWPRREVRAIVEAVRPEVVHLQDPTSIGSTLLAEAGARGLPVVISNHFTLEYVLAYLRFLKPFHPWLRRRLTAAMIRFYNRCQYVICPSETVRATLLALGLRTPVIAISNGVDLNRFFSYAPPATIRAEFDLPNKPLVLYVGRMDQDKDLETLLAAVPHVLACREAHFVLCGGGNLTERLKKQARRAGLEPHVSFLGPFEHESDKLPQVYQLATCFVIPSPHETQSIVTLEAMASGLPVVAARAGALPELIEDGDNGLLFRPGDARDLAEKILTLLGDPALRHRMGRRSLEKVVAHKLDGSLRCIEDVYKKLVDPT
jgi:glycosyltransferase involved in cell wall biosynthesis